MKIYKVDIKGYTQYATAVIAIEDDKDLESKLVDIAIENEGCLDWENTDSFQIEDFKEIKSWEELQREPSCVNEEIETKEDWDNVTLKKFVKGEAVNTQKGEGDA